MLRHGILFNKVLQTSQYIYCYLIIYENKQLDLISQNKKQDF